MKSKNEMKAEKSDCLHLVALLVAGGAAIAACLNCSWNEQNNGPCGSPIPVISTNSYTFGLCDDDVVCVKTASQGAYLYCTDEEFTATAPMFLLTPSGGACFG